MNGPPTDPRSALSRPRRVATALALFLLLTTIPVTIAGVSQQESVQNLPETFQTTAPYDGDEGVYTITVYEQDGDGLRVVKKAEESFRFIHRFHWLPIEGEWQQVHEIREFREFGCYLNDVFVSGYLSVLYDAEGRLIGSGSGCDHNENPVVEEAPGWGTRVLTQNKQRLAMNPQGSPGDRGAYFCGDKHVFQQGPVVLEDLGELLTADCRHEGDGKAGENRYEAIAMVDAGPEEALVVEGQMGADESGTTMQWWFVPSLPYPVRVTVDEGHGQVMAYDLDRFHRGEKPVGPPGGSASVDRQPWEFSGPAEEGIDHPFPLSQALQVAEKDPEFEDYRDYLEAHPDAVVQSAYYFYSEDSRKMHEWAIVLSDGSDESWGFRIHKTVSRVTPEFLEHHTGLQGPEKEPAYSYDARSVDGPEWLEPDELPSVPTVASLFDLYETLTGRQANLWGIQPCRSVCDEGGPYVAVGRGEELRNEQWQEGDLFIGSGSEDRQFEDRLILSANGTLMEWDQSVAEDRYGPNVASEPQESSDFERELSAITIDTVIVWRIPVAVAAGSVFTALALAVGYWLSPLAKIGPTMLFSRVQRDKLLKNASRQTIFQMIEARPGIHYKELVRALEQPASTVKYHLDKLVDGGLVTAAPKTGYTCYFIAGKADRRTMQAAACLKSPVARGLLHAAREHPGITGKEVAARLGVAPATVHHHLKRLEGAGLIARDRADGLVGLKVTTVGKRIYTTLRQGASC